MYIYYSRDITYDTALIETPTSRKQRPAITARMTSIRTPYDINPKNDVIYSYDILQLS